MIPNTSFRRVWEALFDLFTSAWVWAGMTVSALIYTGQIPFISLIVWLCLFKVHSIRTSLRRYEVGVMPARHSLWWLCGAAACLALALATRLLSVLDGEIVLSAELWGLFTFVYWKLESDLEKIAASNISAQRQLPAALALGVPAEVTLTLINQGPYIWHGRIFDEADPALDIQGMPQTITLPAKSTLTLRYSVTARARGMAHFGGTQVRWLTCARLCEVIDTLGEPQTLRIYPNFAAVARYAWLSGDRRRLAQIGIKSWPRRGQGTEFRQLADYRPGDALRHIDWKASQRRQRPIVREYQDERDQRVIFLLDCGRRMRADEAHGTSHFDEALNALMLLSYVALHDGDEVGVMTFGMPEGQQRDFAPRKGAATLHALMNRLHDIQPTISYSDYLVAARKLLVTQRRRSLVIMLTNFQSEDAAGLRPAVQLLRQKHLVLVASLRERVLADILEQPLQRASDATDVAATHLFEQARRDAFIRVTGRDALAIDAEPADLAVTLVNRYHAVKRAGLL